MLAARVPAGKPIFGRAEAYPATGCNTCRVALIPGGRGPRGSLEPRGPAGFSKRINTTILSQFRNYPTYLLYMALSCHTILRSAGESGQRRPREAGEAQVLVPPV